MNYFRKLREDSAKSSHAFLNDRHISQALWLAHGLEEQKARHPKIARLCSLVSGFLQERPDAKIIIFSNFREMVRNLVEVLSQVERARPVEFSGQRYMRQKEQLKRLRDFRDGAYNILVCTSVGEEGLDIPSMDLAIFYEAIPSEIRSIQRRGRVGRQAVGKIVVFLAKNTRDEAFYWSSFAKEKSMKKTLYGMQEKEAQQTLKGF